MLIIKGWLESHRLTSSFCCPESGDEILEWHGGQLSGEESLKRRIVAGVKKRICAGRRKKIQ